MYKVEKWTLRMCMIGLPHVVVLPNIVLLFLMPNVMPTVLLLCVHTKHMVPTFLAILLII